MIIAGAVATPILLGTGVALISVAARRRHAARLTLAPRIDARALGLTIAGRF